MHIQPEVMFQTLSNILIKKGFTKERADQSAKIFTESSVDGIYSHGYMRFPKVIEYIDKGYIDIHAIPEKIEGMGGMERLDGHLGMGVLNASIAMEHAIILAHKYGIGLVAIGNTNHWMRGGTYGWQAANASCIGICFTNTAPNMPAWGAKDSRIGNNPFVLSIPRTNGEHIVVDTAMALFSYGKLQTTRLKNQQLPFPGGFDTDGNLSTDPASIEASRRVLPIGYWKGSGMSIAFDLIANILCMGNTVTQIGRNNKEESGLSQVMIAIDPSSINQDPDFTENLITQVLEDIKSSEPAEKNGSIFYPGESTRNRRNQNQVNGIPVDQGIWEQIEHLL